MNKSLLAIFILVLIGSAIFYFFYLAPAQEVSVSVPETSWQKIDTSFNLSVIDKLDNFLTHGNFPLEVNAKVLRKNDQSKADDPFFN